MKNTKVFLVSNVLLAALVCLAFVSVALGQNDCSCTAPDGSCSASVSCGSRGCIAVCGNNGRCSASCSGGPVAPAEPEQNLYFNQDGNKISADRIQITATQESKLDALRALNKTVTISSRNQNVEAVLSEIASNTKSEISYSSANLNERINIDLKGALVWNVVEALSERGTITINGINVSQLLNTRRALLEGERVNVCLSGITAKNILEELGLLVSIPYRVEPNSPGNIETKLTRKLKDVTLTDILNEVSREANITLEK